MTLSRRSFLLLPLGLAACNLDRRIFEISGLTMGTYYKVLAVNIPQTVTQNHLKEAIEASLQQVNKHLSNWDKDSEISRFNQHATQDAFSLSPILSEVMQTADKVHKQSAGRFDTTIAPLIELWGFGTKQTQRQAPSQQALERALAQSGQANNLLISANSLQKKRADAQVFLAAIGKGFGADLIARALNKFQIKDYMIEIGGDLYASGHNEAGLPWQIGIETPLASSRDISEVVGISNLGMASSGDYRNYFEQNGARYSHVIDPTTGRPITHLTASATVLADTAMLADAWATAMLTLGSEEGLKIADANNIGVMFIDRDKTSNALRFKVTKNNRFKELQA